MSKCNAILPIEHVIMSNCHAFLYTYRKCYYMSNTPVIMSNTPVIMSNGHVIMAKCHAILSIWEQHDHLT